MHANQRRRMHKTDQFQSNYLKPYSGCIFGMESLLGLCFFVGVVKAVCLTEDTAKCYGIEKLNKQEINKR